MPGRNTISGVLSLTGRFIGALLLALLATSAFAHRQAADGDGTGAGIPIPNLTHGQMAVIAANMPDILALADRQTGLDETARRLRAFVDWQYFFCFRGLVPGSLKDEESPFNECSHAYLAGTQALLLELRQTRGDRAEVRALVDKVGLDMVRNNASLVLCRFSGEAFNTADVVSPRWSEVPGHPPSLATFGSLAFLIGGALWLGLRRRTAPVSAPLPAG
ncbi:hypothetical protein FZC33_27315 [Labrys sp. KNU-23]|uniref:hypothetical protein n=1 Tax=Labrys sp. KNU-23 TaxID=2789216 RepID=UPI0011EEE545|nr:hypothetical protein [Labrys sp. KNU-23]QEN89795.1 hypothetical protein FZC33_27315 [Labrys sp. KNU-23]